MPADAYTQLPDLLQALAECGYDVHFRLKDGEWAAECDEPRKLASGPTQWDACVTLMRALGFTGLKT